jgi:bacterioferritin
MAKSARTQRTFRNEIKNGKGGKPVPGNSENVERQALIDGLNLDLAGEYQAILMYIHYSAKLTGPYRRELRALFQAEIADEQGHAQFLSDKIAALGGEPTTEPRPVPSAEHPLDMLEHALAAEEKAIEDYNARILQAASFRDFGLKVVLENQVADETRHKEEIERILAGWNEVILERDRQVDQWQDDGGQG